jgi:hypothetical protein
LNSARNTDEARDRRLKFYELTGEEMIEAV